MQLAEFVIKTDHKSLAHLNDQRLHTDWRQKALTKMMGLQYKIVYKQGALNGAADALSRKPVHSSEVYAIMQGTPVWLESVVASYTNDASAQEKVQKLVLDPSAVPGFTLSAGVLRCNGRIFLGDDNALQAQIISAFHDSPVGGSFWFPSHIQKVGILIQMA